jgi:hypothetical protein
VIRPRRAGAVFVPMAEASTFRVTRRAGVLGVIIGNRFYGVMFRR